MKAILNKLWGNNKRSTDVKAELRAVKLSKLSDIQSEFETEADEVLRIKASLDAKVETAWSEAQLAQEYSSNTKSLDALYTLEEQFIDLMGEAPQEIKDVIAEMELFYQENNEKYTELTEKLSDIYDSI